MKDASVWGQLLRSYCAVTAQQYSVGGGFRCIYIDVFRCLLSWDFLSHPLAPLERFNPKKTGPFWGKPVALHRVSSGAGFVGPLGVSARGFLKDHLERQSQGEVRRWRARCFWLVSCFSFWGLLAELRCGGWCFEICWKWRDPRRQPVSASPASTWFNTLVKQQSPWWVI